MTLFNLNPKTRMKVINFIKKHRFMVLIASCALYLICSRLIAMIIANNNTSAGGEFIESNDLELIPYAHVWSSKSKNCFAGLKGVGQDCKRDLDRVLDYCAADIIDNPDYLASPDVEAVDSDMMLVHLLVTIRHGDRTAINRIKGSLVYRESEYNKIKLQRPQARNHLHKLRHFNIKDDQNSSKYFNYINDSFVFRVSDGALSPGMLTSLGFLQHIKLGEKLNAMYSKYLASEVRHPHQVYIRSTNYPRTIQSAAAFVSSLLPHTGGPKGKFTINTLTNEDDEVMHGVGLKLSSSHVTALDGSTGGDEVRSGSCLRAYHFGQAEMKAFVPSAEAMSGVSAMFGNDVNKQTITELADSVLPHICHQSQLPCLYEDPNKCMSPVLVSKLMDDADRHFCDRYFGSNGGYEATKLSMYPLLSEILGRLDHAKETYINSFSENSETMKKKKSPKLNVLSGHDTVIAPIIATLVGQDVKNQVPKLCEWPNYASVIVFELWSDLTKSQLEGFENGDLNLFDNNFYTQIVYNGQSISQYIPECKIRVQSQQGKDESIKVRACTLSELKKRVRSLLGDASSLEQACSLPSSTKNQNQI